MAFEGRRTSFARLQGRSGLHDPAAARASGIPVFYYLFELKFKCVRDQEFVIGGFTAPKGSRVGFGALLVGYYDHGELVYAGKVGTGYDTEQVVPESR